MKILIKQLQRVRSMPVIRKPGFMDYRLRLVESDAKLPYLDQLLVTRRVLNERMTQDIWDEITREVSYETTKYFHERNFMRFPALCCKVTAKAVEAVTGLKAIGGTYRPFPGEIGHYWNRDDKNSLYVDLGLDPFVDESERRDVYLIEIGSRELREEKFETEIIEGWDGSVRDSSGKEILNVSDIASEVRSRCGLYP